MNKIVMVTPQEKSVVVETKKTHIVSVGTPGPPGPPGQDAESVAATYIAGTGGVNAYQIVYVSGAGTVLAANAQNETHAGRVVGIAAESTAAGQTVEVRRTGSVTNTGWTLTPGSRYYLQAGGEIGTNTDGLRFVQKIGVAETSTKLFLQIEPAIVQ